MSIVTAPSLQESVENIRTTMQQGLKHSAKHDHFRKSIHSILAEITDKIRSLPTADDTPLMKVADECAKEVQEKPVECFLTLLVKLRDDIDKYCGRQPMNTDEDTTKDATEPQPSTSTASRNGVDQDNGTSWESDLPLISMSHVSSLEGSANNTWDTMSDTSGNARSPSEETVIYTKEESDSDIEIVYETSPSWKERPRVKVEPADPLDAPEVSSAVAPLCTSQPRAGSASSRRPCRSGKCYICDNGQQGCRLKNTVFKITCTSCKTSRIKETAGPLKNIVYDYHNQLARQKGPLGKHARKRHSQTDLTRLKFNYEILCTIEYGTDRRKKKRDEINKLKEQGLWWA